MLPPSSIALFNGVLRLLLLITELKKFYSLYTLLDFLASPCVLFCFICTVRKTLVLFSYTRLLHNLPKMQNTDMVSVRPLIRYFADLKNSPETPSSAGKRGLPLKANRHNTRRGNQLFDYTKGLPVRNSAEMSGEDDGDMGEAYQDRVGYG